MPSISSPVDSHGNVHERQRMMIPIKRLTRSRPSYFRGQLLDETDFRAEQDYYRNAFLLHNTKFHSWGVVSGLTVGLHENRKVSVAPGMAVDGLGREIVLEETAVLDVSAFGTDQPFYVTLSYEEALGEQRQSEFGEGPARVMEYSVLSAATSEGSGGAVTLARVQLESGGSGGTVSYAHTPYASSVIGPGQIGVRELAAGLRTGWVRMPFKPIPLEDRPPFRIGPTEARSTDEGAAGSMAIPVPPGVTHVQRFRIAGEKNDGTIKVEFFRCGWDPVEDDHEKSSMLTVEFDSKTTSAGRSPKAKVAESFSYTGPLNGELDAQYHGLAVVITASKKASISLIAVEFGYSGGAALD